MKEGKKKKKHSIKAIRQQKNGNSIPIQNEHNYERDIYIYQGLQKSKTIYKATNRFPSNKKKREGNRNSKVAYYNPTTKAKNLMTLFFILSPIFISPSEDKNSWIIAALF